MTAREEILARARAALATAPTPPAGSYRRAGTTDPAALVAQLTGRLVDYRAQVRETTPTDLAATVAALLDGTAVVPADVPADWLQAYGGTVRRDDPPVPTGELDRAGVSVLTGCAVAIAETGTLVLDAGPAQGRRALTLVPDHHVCVVHVDQVVATVGEALARLVDPTRPLTLISGPSATSDIELKRVEGVHGPRRLDVIVCR